MIMLPRDVGFGSTGPVVSGRDILCNTRLQITDSRDMIGRKKCEAKLMVTPCFPLDVYM